MSTQGRRVDGARNRGDGTDPAELAQRGPVGGKEHHHRLWYVYSSLDFIKVSCAGISLSIDT